MVEYRVRYFGNNRICKSVEELESLLGKDFLGRSISICMVVSSRIRGLSFIDISKGGRIILTSYHDSIL